MKSPHQASGVEYATTASILAESFSANAMRTDFGKRLMIGVVDFSWANRDAKSAAGGTMFCGFVCNPVPATEAGEMHVSQCQIVKPLA